MPNVNVPLPEGFWDRVNEACERSGLKKIEIARRMGVERKSLYPNGSSTGTNRNWHSGKIALFCKVTGVSADWLLGLSVRKHINAKDAIGRPVRFKVIDTKTGKEAILDWRSVLGTKWFKDATKHVDPRKHYMTYIDRNKGWCVDAEGEPFLIDIFGDTLYPPKGRYIATRSF